jgi:hypothetical protein
VIEPEPLLFCRPLVGTVLRMPAAAIYLDPAGNPGNDLAALVGAFDREQRLAYVGIGVAVQALDR